jgi:hypothetical protein
MNFHPDALVQLAGMAVDDRLRDADRRRQQRILRRAFRRPPTDPRYGFVPADEPSRRSRVASEPLQLDDVVCVIDEGHLSATT